MSEHPHEPTNPAPAAPLATRLAPLLIALGVAPWLYLCIRHYVDRPLNGDTGMFQYVAWCIRRGERLYDGITMPDGPFVYLVHIPAQILGAMTDERLRAFDVVLHLTVAAAMGALLAGAGRAPPSRLGRAIWAVVAASMWGSYLFVLDWAASVQRDAYYALFGSLALVLAYAAPAHAGRARRAALFLSGFLPAFVTFGKHSGVIYLGLAGLSVLLGEAPAGEARRRRLHVFLAGAAAGLGAVLAFVLAFGSLRGLLFWYFVYPFRVYRYFFPTTFSAMLAAGEPWRTQEPFCAAATLGGLAAVALRFLPPRAIGICLAPALQMVAFLLQRKGWPYQTHPVIAGAHLVVLLGLVTLWTEESAQRRGLCWGALLLVYARCVDELQQSPWLGETPRPNVSMREKVAEYLGQHTSPDDRVFYYGIDPYTLFLAHRLPATPHPVTFVLRFAPALAKPSVPEATGPDDAARARITALQPPVAEQACSRLAAHPPAAMVFATTPPNTGADAVQDVVELCPALRPMLAAQYREATVIEKTRVYLRNDRK